MNMKINELNIEKIKKLIIFVLMIFPFCIAILYSFPAADDFSNAVAFKEDFVGSHLKTAFTQTKKLYMTWQGTYFGVFLLEILSPLFRGGIELNRICCMSIVILYAISLYYMIHVFFELFQKQDTYIVLISWIFFFFSTTSFMSMAESFYWFTGGCMYTVPSAFAFLAFSFMIKCFENSKKKKYLLFGMICSFLASGGSLQVSALVCVGLLGIALYSWIYTKRSNVSQLIVFGTGVIGALINVVAPGNYVRHDVISSEMNIIGALVWAFKSILKHMCMLFLDTHLAVCIVILFLVFLFILRNIKIEIKYSRLIFLFLCFGLVIIDFPVFLGYDGDDYFPLRCEFIELIGIIFFLFICTFILASKFANKGMIKWNREVSFIICVVVGLETLNICSNMSITDYTSANILYRWINGELDTYAKCYNEIFEEISNGKELNVLVETVPDTMNIYPSVGIKNDKNDWVNMEISKYYDVTSIQLMRPLKEIQTLDDYLIYLNNDDYCSMIEVNNSDIWMDDKYVELFKDLGIDSEEITENTSFFLINESGKDVEYVSDFRQNGLQIETSRGIVKVFISEDGRYGVYLNDIECYVGMLKEVIDIRIVVFSKETMEKVDDVIFSYSIVKEKDKEVLAVNGLSRQ